MNPAKAGRLNPAEAGRLNPAKAGLHVHCLVALAAAACLVMPHAASAQSAEGSFTRTLKVTGAVDLAIRSGSGRIRVHPGPEGTVTIAGRIRAHSWWFSGNPAERVRRIEKNPPIEQAGNSIRVGQSLDERLFRNVSISYDVTVPAQASVNAATGSGRVDIGDLRGSVEAHSGSGDVVVGRIGGPVVASTGSGDIEVAGAQGLDAHSGSGSIEARAIGGAVKARTGSGGVRLDHSGKGDLDLSSSSGDVVVTGVEGAARVSASSGGITVEGRPSGPWNIHSSSGGVTLRIPPDASFNLDAHVSSGGIDLAHPVNVVGSVGRRRMQGKVRGGGALVNVSTSSGGIRIQ
jgi:hypothetical protein